MKQDRMSAKDYRAAVAGPNGLRALALQMRSAHERDKQHDHMKQEPVTVILPDTVSVNRLYFNVAGKGRVSTPEYRKWKRRARKALVFQGSGIVTGWVRIERVFPLRLFKNGKPRRRDVTNLIKAIDDALVNGGVIEDDCNVWSGSETWQAGIDEIRVKVTPVQGF